MCILLQKYGIAYIYIYIAVYKIIIFTQLYIYIYIQTKFSTNMRRFHIYEYLSSIVELKFNGNHCLTKEYYCAYKLKNNEKWGVQYFDLNHSINFSTVPQQIIIIKIYFCDVHRWCIVIYILTLVKSSLKNQNKKIIIFKTNVYKTNIPIFDIYIYILLKCSYFYKSIFVNSHNFFLIFLLHITPCKR